MIKEPSDRRGDLVAVCLERKVAGIKEAHIGVRDVAFECLRTRRQEERIVLTPHRQTGRLVFAEIAVKFGIERDVALIVAEQIELNFVGPGARQVEVVERKSVRRHERRVGGTVHVLPDRRLRREERTERLTVRLRRFAPVGSDRVPSVAQPFLIGVAVLRDDRRDALGMPYCQSKTCWRAIVEYVDRKAIQTDDLGEAIDDVGEIVERVTGLVTARHVRTTKPGKVGRHDMELLRELWHEFTEHMTRARKSVKQDRKG